MHQAASRFAVTAQEAGVTRDLPRALGALSQVTTPMRGLPCRLSPEIRNCTCASCLLHYFSCLRWQHPSAHAFQPKAEKVVDNVYALIGPLGQRSPENDGLNANFGFIVTPKGVILIDSGASRLGAEKIAAAIGKVTDKPVRWVINTGSQDHRWLGNDYFAGKGAEVIAHAAHRCHPGRIRGAAHGQADPLSRRAHAGHASRCLHRKPWQVIQPRWNWAARP